LTYRKIDNDFDRHIENNWKIIFHQGTKVKNK
jgi:hypothetical protein